LVVVIGEVGKREADCVKNTGTACLLTYFSSYPGKTRTHFTFPFLIPSSLFLHELSPTLTCATSILKMKTNVPPTCHKFLII